MTDELDFLIGSLHHLHTDLQERLYTSDASTQVQPESFSSALLNLPKPILIKILSFLNFTQDLPSALESCKTLHLVITSLPYQTLSYKNLIRKFSIYSLPHSNSAEEEFKNEESYQLIESKAEAMIQIKKAAAFNNFVGPKIMNQGKKIEELTKEVTRLQEELRIQTSICNKCIDKISRVEKQCENLNLEKEKRINEAELIRNKEENELEFMRTKFGEINKEKESLRKEVILLEKELEMQKLTKSKLSNDFSGYESAFTKIQEYFLSMFSPKLEEIIQSFKGEL